MILSVIGGPQGCLFKLIEVQLVELQEYAELLETSFTREVEELIARVEMEASELPQRRRDEFKELFSDDYWKFSEIFPNIFRYSLFVMCYTFLEHHLDGLCKYLNRGNKYSIELEDLKGKGIFRAQRYLQKVACITFPEKTPEWKKILKYNHIRNLIVHKGGQLHSGGGDVQTIAGFVKDGLKIRLDSQNRIIFSKDFCFDVIETLKTLMYELSKSFGP